MNVTVDKSSTSSRWIARVTQHVNKQIHTLLLLDTPWLQVYSGPAKSTAALVNGGASVTRNVGSGGAGGAQSGFPSKRLHMVHLWMNDLTKLLPPIFAMNFCERFLHSIVLHPLMSIPHN